MNNKLSFPEQSETPLSPSTIFSAVTITTPKGIITVEGIVTRLTEFPKRNPKWIYGDLKDEVSDYSIGFRCPIHKSPLAEGELATIRGVVVFQQQTKLAIRIDGDCIDHKTAKRRIAHPIAVRSERSKIKLAEFIEQFGIEKLHLIGTKLAIQDVHTALSPVSSQRSMLSTTISNFNSPDDLLNAARKAIEKGAMGVMFTRGGDDTTLQHWDDPIFMSDLMELDRSIYTALGHSNQSFSIEKYICDESFPTPSGAGHAVLKALKTLSSADYLRSQLSEKTNEIRKINNKMIQLARDLAEVQDKNGKLAMVSCALFGVSGLLIYLLV